MIVKTVPVYINGKYVFDYELANLFDKHGNGDGDEHVLCAVATRIIEMIEEQLGYNVEIPGTLHNSYSITSLERDGRTVWENKHWYGAFDNYEEVWNSLPEDLKHFFEKLEKEEVHIQV